MGWFDASCHALTTLATGGFSTQNASTGAFNSRTIEIITIIFMVLASANFGLYYAAVKGKLNVILKDSEFRFYIFLLTAGSVIIIFSLLGSGQPIITTTGIAEQATLGEAVTQGVFTAVSSKRILDSPLQTTTHGHSQQKLSSS